ncbi:MAG: S49 family peptidase [Anaerolineae bacterium]|nr:S49 family peptidase [Anaerolineae bacterium]
MELRYRPNWPTLLLGSILFVLLTWALLHQLPQAIVPRPAVGIIRINDDIWYGSNILFQAEIEAARRDRRIRAVVVQFDSPGGEVAASQSLFLELQNLRREMPVVGSVDSMAASGAYYAALATDPIYAKPSSSVGNVGVWGRVPPDLGVNDFIITSGPFKLTGSNREEFLRELESVKREFLATVVSQRGARLTLTPAELSQGLLYSGREAVRLGLIDHIGGQTDAVAEAARQAGIAHYDTVDLEVRVLGERPRYYSLNESWVGAADPVTGQRNLPYGIYLLYDAQLRGVP